MKSALYAGASQIDISPPLGTQLAGDVGRCRPTEIVRDNLYARILILKHRQTTTCNVSCDVVGITKECSDPLREEIAGLLKTGVEGVMINAQQSHSAPCVGNHCIKKSTYIKKHPWLGGGDKAYQKLFCNRVIQGVKEALKNMEKAKVKAGRGMNSEVAFNRRFVMRDGSVSNQPGADEVNSILCCEGPVDPEVGLLVLESLKTGKNIACLIHYTAHPCHGYPQRWASADWPGLWSQAVGARFKCPCLMFNGFCGNLITFDYINREEHNFDMHSDVVSLMRTTSKIIPNLEGMDCLPLRYSSTIIPAKMRALSPEYVAKARALLRKHPAPVFTAPDNVQWDWVFAVICLELSEYAEKNHGTYDVELQAFRIGDFTVLGCPAEPYVESQLQIKMNSPARYLFCAHETNDIFAYIPTRQALERRCNSDNQWKDLSPVIARLVPETLDVITAESRTLIQKLYK